MDTTEIGIVETKNILKLIFDLYQYDFRDFALISLKRRIEKSIELHNIKFVDVLLNRLRDDKNFLDLFLFELSVESTEMFRDPSLWRMLRDEYFPLVVRNGNTFRIWIPSCVSGDELFTLAIVLKECGLTENVEIFAGYLSNASLSFIQSGNIRPNKLEVSTENYKRYQGKFNFKDYFIQGEGQPIKDRNLIKNVKFIRQNLEFDMSPKNVDMIIFRNQMIYFNQTHTDKILGVLWDSLNSSGRLVLGIKELLIPSGSGKNFRVLNESESIYQKK